MLGQIRRLLLGWLFRSIYLASVAGHRLGILCYVRRSSVISGASCGRSLGRAAREQVDDGDIYDRLCWGNDLFHLQGLLLTFGSGVSFDKPFLLAH